MKYSTIPLAQTLVSLCKEKEIAHIVISPGSRNAPLTIGFTENPAFKTYSIVDERCAGFFALGMAQQLQKPVALVCTSGSALLNYYPAISEAFYSDIPLVVLSADRPIERIDIGDGQTIRQKNIFENHIEYSANLHSELVLEGVSDNPKIKQKQFESHSYNEREINLALNTAIEKQGPVHINIPFYEPLYLTTEAPNGLPLLISPDIKYKQLDPDDLKPYQETWKNAKKKLVLVGVMPPDSIEQELLNQLVNDESVLVLTETTSNLHHPRIFSKIDTLISAMSDEDFEMLQPEVLLTFGGMIVSKKIKAFLRDYQPKHHWHLDEKKAYNTFFCLNKHFETSAHNFLSFFLREILPIESSYYSYFDAIRAHRHKQQLSYSEIIPFTDFKVFDQLLAYLPKKVKLQLGNSSTIRYCQLFELDPSIAVNCNRGTSGIEGTTSTAIGAAVVSAKQTVLITGDLSFFYDSNALWNNYIPVSFRIIVINNGGGGIFRILPGDKNTANFETYFETKHQLTARQLCEMYGFEYEKASSENELSESLARFYQKSEAPKLLEIQTPSAINDVVLLDYFKHIR